MFPNGDFVRYTSPVWIAVRRCFHFGLGDFEFQRESGKLVKNVLWLFQSKLLLIITLVHFDKERYIIFRKFAILCLEDNKMNNNHVTCIIILTFSISFGRTLDLSQVDIC